jgi:hypothetical protein
MSKRELRMEPLIDMRPIFKYIYTYHDFHPLLRVFKLCDTLSHALLYADGGSGSIVPTCFSLKS